MEKILKVCDIYGSDFSLRINGESKFKSATGGLLSIVTFFVFCWATIEFGRDFYLRTNPSVSMEDGIYGLNKTPLINGSEYSDKIIAFQYNKKYDKFSLPYVFSNYVNQTFLTECDPEFLKVNYLDAGSPDLFNKYYSSRCLKLNDYSIGSYGEILSNSPLLIQWALCRDYSEEEKVNLNMTNCDDSYNETISTMYLMVSLIKTGFNQNNEIPFVSKYTIDYKVLTSDKMSTVVYPFQVFYLSDNLGWISDDVVKHSDISFNNPILNQYPNEDPTDLIPITLAIAVADDYKTFTRSYMKFQDFLAKLGGFMKLVLIVLNFFCFLIRIYLIDNYIVQKLFDNNIIIGNNLNIPNKSMINQSNYFADKSGGALFKVNNSNLPEINANEIKEIPIRKENFTVNNFQMIKDNSSEFRSARVNNVPNYKNEFKNDFGELSKNVEMKSRISLEKPELERKRSLTKSTKEIKKPDTTISVAQYIPALLYNLLGKSFDSSTDRGRRLEQARNKILIAEKVRDFDHILMKMNELEAMQNMIFNENQKICLSYMQKPKQTEDDTLKKLKTLKADPEDNLQRLEAYFSRLLRENEGNLHGYDAHLFNNLEQQIRIKIISNAA